MRAIAGIQTDAVVDHLDHGGWATRAA